MKTIVWKFILTIVTLAIDVIFPYDGPFEAIAFHLLAKGRKYER